MGRRSEEGASEGRGLQGKPTTLADVATAAGVAISTVSRSFTNPGRVNVRTRERIERVAAELGYQPNVLARALESGRTRTLGLVVSDVTNPHFFGLIRGAEHQAATAGYTLLLGDAQQSPQTERAAIGRFSGFVDGFILAASRLPTRELAPTLGGRPVVLVNRESAGIASVTTDHVEGPRQIVEHLHSLGHRRLVFLGGPRESWSGAKRWRAVREAAHTLGMAAAVAGPFPVSIEGGPAAADAALGLDATAVIAHNDLLAIGALKRFTERGIRIPRDISVVGFDDIFGADFCAPPLTTLAGPLEEVGRTAVSMLLAGETHLARRVALPSHLKIRASTGPAADG
ncbi:LacI family DNA-binding transcriptional regulator [Streptomyces sp. NPDC002795]|uniref:LacI family DNA-binding transcriptional regulator n=1 Tax=Streptomyces sp. NPDC002795 TaxID=3364665 RepID=UPI0036A07A4C